MGLAGGGLGAEQREIVLAVSLGLLQGYPGDGGAILGGGHDASRTASRSRWP